MFEDGIKKKGVALLIAALCVSVAVLAQTLLARDSDDERGGSGRRRGGMPGRMGGPPSMIASGGFVYILKGQTLYKIDTSTLKVSKKATIEFDRPNGRNSRDSRRRSSDDW